MDKNALHKDEQIKKLEELLANEEAIEELASMELVTMPGYLGQEILDSIENYKKVRMRNKKFQLFCYSTKVTLATACAIVMLFSVSDIREITSNREFVKFENTSYIADMFDFITEKIFDGGLYNENEKK